MRRSLKSKRNQLEFESFKKYKELLHLWENAGLLDVVYFDEAGFNLTPNIPYGWQEINETIELPSSSSSTLSVLGFLGKSCQFQGFTVQGTVNSEIAINCFHEYSNTLTKETVVIIDNAPIHTSNAFKAEIEGWKQKKLFIKYLPKYSPELNDIETLWKFTKYEWMPFDAYENKAKLQESVEKIMRKIGVELFVDFKSRIP